MSGEVWAGLGAALLTLLAALVALPKMRADARKSNAEAEQIEWRTLAAEIHRLNKRAEEQDRRIAAQDKRIAELEKLDHERIDREAALEKENHRLRLEVGSLRRRIGQLEEIIKTRTTPEDMRAQLAAMERGTGASDK